MRNYVIINGVNSTTIQGLAINILPPITKPLIRTQIEEIDGRDGDLVTELGYSAYDKQMEIGLWGTYDIDAIIKYFTGEGTIVFSTEPDKYYYFKILNQIDYEKLLKFKKATITFHCQPYKYPTSETPLEEQYEYVEATGTDLTLNNTEETIFNKFDLKGNTYQEGTPTPESPQDIHVVSGDNSIEVCGKNLLDKNSVTTGKWLNTSGELETASNYVVSDYIEVVPGGKYYLPDRGTTRTKYYLENKSVYSNTWDVSSLAQTITIPTGVKYIRMSILVNGTGAIDLNTFQFEKGSTATTYEQYQGASYPINLGDIELCKIGTYQDKIDKSTGKNLVDISQTIVGKAWNNATNADRAVVYTKVKPSTKYTISFSTKNHLVGMYDFQKENKEDATTTYSASEITDTKTITTQSNTNWLGIQFNKVNITMADVEKVLLMIQEGEITTPVYEPYGTGWYVKKEIGKVVLDGTQLISNPSTSGYENLYYIGTAQLNISYLTGGWCDCFYYNTEATPTANSGALSQLKNNQACFRTGTTLDRLYIKTNLYTSAPTDLQTWLSTHNTTVYYVLATPTYTKIEGTLESQLNALSGANSYNSQTNITQTNNDMPFILDVSALKDGSDHLIIDNIGTAYSKPTIDIEGTGIVDIYLNDEQIFEIDLTTQNEIIIDTEKMEAYTPDNTLANRLVTGDYSNFKLAPGENDLRFSGDLTKATVTRYIRWI